MCWNQRKIVHSTDDDKTHLKCFSFCFWANTDSLTTTTFGTQWAIRYPSYDLPSPSTRHHTFPSHDQMRHDFLSYSVPFERHMFGMCRNTLINRFVSLHSRNGCQIFRYCWRKWRHNASIFKYAHKDYFCSQLNRWTSVCHLLAVNMQRQRLHDIPDGLNKFQWIIINNNNLSCVCLRSGKWNSTQIIGCMRIVYTNRKTIDKQSVRLGMNKWTGVSCCACVSSNDRDGCWYTNECGLARKAENLWRMSIRNDNIKNNWQQIKARVLASVMSICSIASEEKIIYSNWKLVTLAVRQINWYIDICRSKYAVRTDATQRSIYWITHRLFC